VAVEIDESLACRLRATVPPNVEIVTQDALTADLRGLVPEGARLAGNLPYYVSSPLLRRFLSLRGHVHDVHVMLQERARRSRRLPARESTGSSRCSMPCGPTPTCPPAFPRAASPPRPGSPRRSCGPGSETPRAPTWATWRSSSSSSREPSPAGAEPLKTTSKIAILTSRNTLGPSTRGPGLRRYPLWSLQRFGEP
jgi:hypothetical protein